MTSQAQKNSGYLLPEQLTGHPLLCVDLLIPDVDEYRAAFLGALGTLSDWWNWEKSYQPGDTRASQAALYWRQLFLDHLCISYGKHYNPKKNRRLPDGWIMNGNVTTGTVKVSVSDFLAQYLSEKITAGDGIEITTEVSDGVETLRIAATPATPAFSVGDFKYSAQQADHDGWLICDGRYFTAGTYPELDAVIAGVYGNPPTPTGSRLPDMRGRVPVAQGQGSGLTDRGIGGIYGVESVNLAVSELPAHTHPLESSNGTDLNRTTGGVASSATGLNPAGIFATAPFTPLTTLSAGSGAAHQNMQPSVTIGNLFIYSGSA